MSTLRSLFIGIIAPVALYFGYIGASCAQVSDCTDGGCEPFAQDCFEQGNYPVCLNARYGEGLPSAKEEHLCDVAWAIMEKNCQKDNPQPCLVAEDRVLDRCFFVPLTLCLDPNVSAELYNSHPDICPGTCTDIVGACNNE